MRISTGWNDYELLDAASGERLERWGDIILIRPDPQVIWHSVKQHPLWEMAHARYIRSASGGGQWMRMRPVPESWTVRYHLDSINRDLVFALKPMGFKHTGLFPEQADNWELVSGLIAASQRSQPVSVLNLFGYTGAATMACAAAGAQVTHVDASRGMVCWGRDNLSLSGMVKTPVRWLVDDCVKLVRREQRRGNRYDAIIMDPPSYGRGPGGEIWRLEEQIYHFVEACSALLSDNALFFLINSYTTGLSPSVMGYILDLLVKSKQGGCVTAEEIALPVSGTSRALPCGASAFWNRLPRKSQIIIPERSHDLNNE